MKKYIFACLFAYLSNTTFAQSAQLINTNQNINIIQDSISVLISPGTDNTSTISSLEVLLKSTSGITYNGYCSNHNLFLLMVDKNSYATAQLFYTQIKSTSNINTLLLKVGSASDILPFCTESIVPETPQTILAKKALLDK